MKLAPKTEATFLGCSAHSCLTFSANVFNKVMLSWQRQPDASILEKHNKLGCCNQSRAPARRMPFLLHRASGPFLSPNLVTPSPHSASTQSVQPVPVTSLWITPLKNSTGNLDLTLTGNHKTHTVQVWAHVWGHRTLSCTFHDVFLRQGLSLAWGGTIVRLAWLVRKLWITMLRCTAFCAGSGVWTHVYRFARQTLYWLCHFLGLAHNSLLTMMRKHLY